MKRIMCLVLSVLFFIPMFMSCLPDPPTAETYIDGRVGVWAGNKYAEVTEIKYDISGDYDVINIPDEYNGLPIRSIGGEYYFCFSTPFGADHISQSSVSGRPLNVVRSSSFNVYINIGKNIEKIMYPDIWTFYVDVGDGKYYKYEPVFIWNCSEENPIFFSKDGALYRKENGKIDLNFPTLNRITYEQTLSCGENVRPKDYDCLNNYHLDCSKDEYVIDLSQPPYSGLEKVGRVGSCANIRPYGDGVITRIVDEREIVGEETIDVTVIIGRRAEQVNISNFWFLRKTDGGYIRYNSHIILEFADPDAVYVEDDGTLIKVSK